jgi:GNAT superfamily N-acetyltransferase
LTLRIRAAEPADVPLIANLIRQLAKFEKLDDDVVLTEDLLMTGLFGPRPYAETVIAEDDALPVGFALFFHTFSTFLARPGIYLEDLFVLSDHRGRGIGRALLAHLAQLAVQRGCGRLEWAVLNWNQDAIRFYERLGARPNSEWTVYRLTGEALSALGRE